MKNRILATICLLISAGLLGSSVPARADWFGPKGYDSGRGHSSQRHYKWRHQMRRHRRRGGDFRDRGYGRRHRIRHRMERRRMYDRGFRRDRGGYGRGSDRFDRDRGRGRGGNRAGCASLDQLIYQVQRNGNRVLRASRQRGGNSVVFVVIYRGRDGRTYQIRKRGC